MISIINEGIISHLKNNWGKYAAGAAGLAAGVVAGTHSDEVAGAAKTFIKDKEDSARNFLNNRTPEGQAAAAKTAADNAAKQAEEKANAEKEAANNAAEAAKKAKFDEYQRSNSSIVG